MQQFYYKKNCIQQLKGFCHAVQTGSISKAADRMGLNQSTVTLQIQSLERDLKTQLFDRDKKRIKLNKNGEIFYQMISFYLNGIESAYEEFLRKKKNESCKIRIAAHHVAITHILPKSIKKFQNLYPKAMLAIKNIAVDDALKRLQEDEIDMMLYPNINPPAEFMSQICFSYNPVLIMHKDHPLASKKDIKLQDVSEYNTVRIDKKLISLPLFEKIFEELKFKTNIEFENGNWEMIKSFVKQGIGIGFVSELCVDKNDKNLTYRRLNDYFPVMEYKLIMKNGKIVSKEIEGFINILTEERK